MKLVIIESPFAPSTPAFSGRCIYGKTCAEIAADGEPEVLCSICAEVERVAKIRAAEGELHLAYGRAAIRDSLQRGESPYASHLLYTQPGILDDTDAAERQLGIAAGFAWRHVAHLTAVYADLGISTGMRFGIDEARRYGLHVEIRSIDGWQR